MPKCPLPDSAIVGKRPMARLIRTWKIVLFSYIAITIKPVSLYAIPVGINPRSMHVLVIIILGGDCDQRIAQS